MTNHPSQWKRHDVLDNDRRAVEEPKELALADDEDDERPSQWYSRISKLLAVLSLIVIFAIVVYTTARPQGYLVTTDDSSTVAAFIRLAAMSPSSLW